MKSIDQITERQAAPSSEDAQEITTNITNAFSEGISPDELQFSTLWRAFITAAHQPTKNVAIQQEQLVKLLKKIKEQGQLKHEQNVCTTKLGKAWTDLPGFEAEIRETWGSAPPTLSTEQWTSLNAFAARLTDAHVIDLSLYAIFSLRDALEIQRPLSERDTEQGDQPPQKHEDAPVSELLPGALQWFEHCGSIMAGLTMRSHVFPKDEDSRDPAFPGKICEDTGIAKRGFSVARWKFWTQRLQPIADTKDNAGGREKIAKIAYQGMEKMKSMDEEINSMSEDMGRLHGSAHKDR